MQKNEAQGRLIQVSYDWPFTLTSTHDNAIVKKLISKA